MAFPTRSLPARLAPVALAAFVALAASQVFAAGPSVSSSPGMVRSSPGVVQDGTSCKNLYDYSLAQDGKLYGNTDGADQTSVNYAASGKIPVEEGNRYTFSKVLLGSSLGRVHFWGADGTTYLGNTVSPLLTGSDPVTGSDPSRTWSKFTVPAGSGARFISMNIIASTAHDSATFDLIRGGAQLEVSEGAASYTAHEPYVPNCVPSASNDGLLRVIKSGGTYYVRSEFNDENDLAIRVDLSDGNNGVTNWDRTFLVPVAAADTDITTYASGTTLVHSNTDDATPLRYNGTTVGANHGHTQFLTVTATGHGKAAADIGSYWIDGGARNWTLIKIPDANTLWFLSDYTKTGDVYAFSTSMTGNLTHVSGATNTAGVTVESAVTGGQIYPTVKDLTAQVLLDGSTDITSASDGTFYGAFVDITNDYEITDLASVLDYIKAHPGVAADFDAPEIETGVRVSVTHRFRLNGSATITTTIEALKQIQIGNCGFVQSSALNDSSRKLYEYIPGTLPIVGGTKTWDFTTPEDITAGVDSLVFTPTYWADATKPPSRMVQILKETDETPVIGFMLAYDLEQGATTSATRKDGVFYAIDMRNTRKQYPTAISSSSTAYPTGNFPAGSTLEVVAHRVYFDPNAQANATVAAWTEDTDGVLVFLDYNQSVTGESVALPVQFNGYAVSTVEKSASFTVNSATVTGGAISVTVTGGYGYAILRLSA